MTKDEIVIGREAPDVWVDLSLDTSLDVSREHARLQRTPEGTFRIKDLSKLGTTVNGVPLAAQPGGRRRRRARTSTAGPTCRTRRASASPAWSTSTSRGLGRGVTGLYFARLGLPAGPARPGRGAGRALAAREKR